MQHIPKKRFGQNFLTDREVISRIIGIIHPQPSDKMLEIGPGLGALTAPLLKTLDHLHVVEIDRDIISRLEKQFPRDKITIHSCDALKFDFSSLGENLRVIGNLPYNISTPLLFHLADFSSNVKDMHFMLQKEVVERMVAEPSGPDYGRLSVMLQYRFDMEKCLEVGPESFYPAPKIDSAIVRIWPARHYETRDFRLFSEIVLAAFSQRRKTLKNTLKNFLKEGDFPKLGIDPQLRAENLSVADFVAIANFLSAE